MTYLSRVVRFTKRSLIALGLITVGACGMYWSQIHTAITDCQKQNNVFRCELKAVPSKQIAKWDYVPSDLDNHAWLGN